MSPWSNNIQLLILLLILLLCKFETIGTVTCEKVVYDIKIVQECPTSKDGWVKKAYYKKCTDKAERNNCTKAAYRHQYHCLINAYLNETLEVCAPERIIFGFCAEFNVAGRVIQRHKSAECNKVFPKCDGIYSSINAYKYPDCYKLVNQNRDFKTTVLPQERRTSAETEHLKTTDLPQERRTSTKPEHSKLSDGIFTVYGWFLLVFLLIFVRIEKFNRSRLRKDDKFLL